MAEGGLMMLYCVKCGDPIEKDELICDKCGYHFTIVEGSPAKVYMNQVPGKNAVSAQGGPVQRGTVQRGPVPVQGRTGQGVPVQPQMPSAGDERFRPPHARVANAPNRANVPNSASVATPGMSQGNVPQGRGRVPQAAGPMMKNGQPPMRQIKTAKPKKKKKGWLIALGVTGGVLAAACLCIVLLFGGILIASAMMGPTDDIVLNNSDDTGADDTSAVVHDNSNMVVMEDEEGYVLDNIRDPFVTLKGDNQDTVTIMIYMNGSNLESNAGMATEDIREILRATLSDNVNVIIQTGGTRKWKTKAIDSDHSQRFLVEDGALTLIDDSLDQLDVTDPQTLEDFIVYCDTNYPADRNMLIMWNHGGGAVYGFGYDEHVNDYYATLTLDEMQTAIRNSGVKFEMIGFDACLMGGIETACAFYDSADYLIASEDFEAGTGWEYQNWLTALGTNSSMPMEDLAQIIIDDFVDESQDSHAEGILALINLRYTRLLFKAWVDFAYSAQADLLACNYSMEMDRSDRAFVWMQTPGERLMRDPLDALFNNGGTDYVIQEYNYAVDLMALADTLNTEEAKALKSALGMALIYSSSTSGDAEMTGLSVTLPYDSADFYEEMKEVYTNCGFDTEYIEFLGSFVNAGGESFDWGQSDWTGWDGYEEDDYDWSDWDQWDEYQEDDFGWDEYDYQWEDWN